jgi:hypothetical protein
VEILADRIFIIRNFLSDQTADFLVDSFKDKLIKNPRWEPGAGDYGAGSSDDFWKEGVYGGPAFTESYRKAELSVNNKILNENSMVNDLLTSICILQEKAAANIYNKNLYMKHTFYCHMAPGSENALHHDNWLEDQVDDHSSLLYLSDDYDGGLIEFPNENVSIKPEKGMFISFVGDESLPHRVTKVERGNRINLISFYGVRK